MIRSLASTLRVPGLVLLALVLAHQLVYIVRYGSIYGEALVHSGHGQGWSDAVTLTIVLSTILGVVAVARLHRLGLLIEALRLAHGHRRPSPTTSAGLESAPLARFGRSWLRLTGLVSAVVLVLLTVQENVEHLATGFGAPGIGILVSPEYPDAVPIVGFVAAAVALVAALLAWRREVLVARLRALLATNTGRPPRISTPALVPDHAPLGSILARRLGRRAPPQALAI